MEKVLPESVPTRHLSGPLSPYELQQLFAQAPVGIGSSITNSGAATSTDALPN